VEKTVALFADQPFNGLEFKFLATRSEYLEFKGWVSEQDKTTVGGNDFLTVLDLVKKTWIAGVDRMTPKTTFHGDRKVLPNAIRYTKPVIVLTDEMSGSGGDGFPALMQGIGRAKIMGARTMGAGGHVEEFPALNCSGNKMRMTKSLFFHPNGTPIENNGVTPDYAYAPSVNDFMNGYLEYQKAYLEKLSALIP
jgi:C-terminal processing protease CtpA/Prc